MIQFEFLQLPKRMPHWKYTLANPQLYTAIALPAKMSSYGVRVQLTIST
jgi:hypothetical protein